MEADWPSNQNDELLVHSGRCLSLGFVCIRFRSFLQGFLCRKSPISTGRNGQLKPGETGHIRNKIRQVSMLLLWFSVSSFFQKHSFFIGSSSSINVIE